MPLGVLQKVGELFKAVGEAVCKLNTGPFSVLEEVGKVQLIVASLLILVVGGTVRYPGAPSAPLVVLPHLPVAHLHPAAVQTACLREPLHDEVRLPLRPLHAEIEPGRYAVRVCLPLEVDHVGVSSDHPYIFEVSALKITAKDHAAHRYHLASA